MTDLTPLKTMLVDAFDAQGEASGFSAYVFDRGDGNITLDGRFNLDRLATAIHDHFLKPDRVRLAVQLACDESVVRTVIDGEDRISTVPFDGFVDRLIASLAGGSQ